MEEGWIKLHRKFLNWEWYTDTNTKVVFIHLLFLANLDDRRYRGMEIKRGECIIGRHKLAYELNLSEREVRTAINHLISTNEITIKTTNKFTIVTICKFDNYQCVKKQTDQQSDQQADQQPTTERPTTDQQPTTPKEYKEYKKERIEEVGKEKAEKSATRSQFSKPTIEECFSYCKELGLSTYDYDGNQKSAAQVTAEKFWDYFESNGWKVGGRATMKDWKSALRNWVRRDAEYNAKRPKSGEQQEREKEFYYQLYDQTK